VAEGAADALAFAWAKMGVAAIAAMKRERAIMQDPQ
jgi:hypothetical protein